MTAKPSILYAIVQLHKRQRELGFRNLGEYGITPDGVYYVTDGRALCFGPGVETICKAHFAVPVHTAIHHYVSLYCAQAAEILKHDPEGTPLVRIPVKPTTQAEIVYAVYKDRAFQGCGWLGRHSFCPITPSPTMIALDVRYNALLQRTRCAYIHTLRGGDQQKTPIVATSVADGITWVVMPVRLVPSKGAKS